jgi:thioredoxin 1
MPIIELNQASFISTVESSSLPVLVMFSSDGCSPCKRLKPILEALAEEQAGKVMVCYLQAEEAATVCQEEGIRSFPTLIVYKNGTETARKVGLMPKAQVLALLA